MHGPRFYRKISLEFARELSRKLDAGDTVALLGHRRSGKELLLNIIDRSHHAKNERTIIRVDCKNLAGDSSEEFVASFAREIKLASNGEVKEGERIGGAIERMIVNELEPSNGRCWLLVRNVMRLPTALTRELLEACQACSTIKKQLGILVAGNSDFVPLTYGPNSPFRDVPQYVISGMDRSTTGAFLVSRKRSISLVDHFEQCSNSTDKEIASDALDKLYSYTGGIVHFVESLINSSRDYPIPNWIKDYEKVWDLSIVQDLIDRYENNFQRDDLLVHDALTELQHSKPSLDIVRNLLSGSSKVRFGFTDGVFDLEVADILRKTDGVYAFSSGVWKHCLTKSLSGSRVASMYLSQKRWAEAWKVLECIDPFVRDQKDESDWLASVSDWENHLFEKAVEGFDSVLLHFFSGIKYLFGFENGAIFDYSAQPHIDVSRTTEILSIPRVPTATWARELSHAEEWSSARQRSVLALRLPSYGLKKRHWGNPVLLLERTDQNRDIESKQARLLKGAAKILWRALAEADETEFSLSAVSIRDEQLKLIDRLSSQLVSKDFGLRAYILRATEVLIETGKFLRVQICLVDGLRSKIQNVASSAIPGESVVKFPTYLSLVDETPKEEWDVQRWVVQHGRFSEILDASDPTQQSPSTQADNCQQLGIKAITVFPLKVSSQVIGTLHVENRAKTLLSSEDKTLLRIVSDQLSLLIHQAKRLTLQQQALDNLPDEVRIVDPLKRELFRNSNSAIAGNVESGWQIKPNSCFCGRCPMLDDGSVDCVVAKLNEQVSKEVFGRNYHRLFQQKAANLAQDWQIVPIKESIGLNEEGKSNDLLLAYVERVHDLSHLFSLQAQLHKWLEIRNLKNVANAVLEYFRELEIYSWCRIYTVVNTDGKSRLESLAGFGSGSDESEKAFNEAKVTFLEDDSMQFPWVLLNDNSGPVIARHCENLSIDQIETQELGGYPTVKLNEPIWLREKLGKKDNIWIEAPLQLGDEYVGLLSLSMPKSMPTVEDMLPMQWELLQWTVFSISIAIYRSRKLESDIMRSKKEVWQLASKLISHQLTNQVLPIELLIENLNDDKAALTQSNQKLLAHSAECIHGIRGIVDNFEKYSSELAFFDDERHLSVNNLIQSLYEFVNIKYPEIQFSTNVKLLDQPLVVVSQMSFYEIVDTMISNSKMHGGMSDEKELTICFQASQVSGPYSQQVDNDGNWVRISIIDNGVGVPDEHKERIFETFQSYHARGTGLGLEVVKRFVQRQHGFVCEDGKYQSGACFSIYLPIAKVDGLHNETK